jgi:hypothetical protein
MATSDPANVYTLPLAPGSPVDPLARPRVAGAVLVTMGGRIILAVEGRGARIRVGRDASSDEVREAAQVLAERHLTRNRMTRRRDLVVETIDGQRAGGSRWAEAFVEAGYRAMGTGLRFLA